MAMTEIDRTEDYVAYALPELIYKDRKIKVEIEVWGEGEELTEVQIKAEEMDELRADQNFMAKIHYLFFAEGLILEEISLREDGAQTKDSMAFMTRLVAIKGLVKRNEDENFDMSPRFEAILHQDLGVTIWLHSGYTDNFWALDMSRLKEACWLEDGTAKLGKTYFTLDFDTFENAMQAVLKLSMIESQTLGFEEV